MIRSIILVIPTVVACGPIPPNFTSPCGAEVNVPGDPQGYALTENSFLESIKKLAPSVDSDLLCMRIKGWQVDIFEGSDGNSWPDPHDPGKRVAGWTRCEGRRIQVANDSWRDNAMTHEMLHAYDECATPDHEGWVESGRYQAILRTIQSFEP